MFFLGVRDVLDIVEEMLFIAGFTPFEVFGDGTFLLPDGVGQLVVVSSLLASCTWTGSFTLAALTSPKASHFFHKMS